MLKKMVRENGNVDVIISSYDNELYRRSLAGWRTKTFQSQTRSGMATETLYMSYDQPQELHQYNYLGTDYRDRERIADKVKRMRDKMAALPVLERKALLESVKDL